MKPQITIESLADYITKIENFKNNGSTILLFRGQSDKKPLLPSIARNAPKINTAELEKEMLDDLKRRSGLLIKKEIRTDWEWLVMAQHFGLRTRLLDWSSNPLIALWFACQKPKKNDSDSFVYVFEADQKLLVDTTKSDNPFKEVKTKILKPYLNNERIIAQSGWFTAHVFSTNTNSFVNFEVNREVKDSITEIRIPGNLRKKIIENLSLIGVNNWTVYTDLGGLCSHLNWKYIDIKS